MFCEKITLQSGKVSWSCVADGPPDPVTGRRNQIPRRGKTKREAMDRVNEAINSLKNDSIDQRVGKNMTFDTLANEWLATYSLTGVKKNTIRVRKHEIGNLNSRIAKVPIANITHSMYQKILNDMAPDFARSTLQGINITAGMIFRYAIRDKKIKDDPTVGATVPKKRKTVEEIKEDPVEGLYLEHDELEEFLLAVQNHGLYLDLERFYLLAFSGMRSGELCALQKDDMVFKDGIIKINKTLYSESNNMRLYELTPPKTDGSVRDIEMEKPVMDMLQRVVKNNDKHKLQYKHMYEDFHDENFVFCRDNGYPFAPKNIGVRMARLVGKTSIKKNATPHIFRHTHISMLTEAGVELPTIMARVGHEDIETTMKVYTHVTNKMKKDASVKINDIYGNILQNINFKLS
ncbi:site-specific integrase [Sporosarcina sp. ANT_H38]|uniref:tyrosine-type recombinase/integrase n=1 Tax=Sporosarcina sp. ANT_H38 TaxID=2597358 RepID=UPI0011F0AC1B|nr:site-specific integrase [Sporosarcina sp. ANT_H38]KAA0941578.1 site-specific integrase [Sporosarcina sp. ANT_H38]